MVMTSSLILLCHISDRPREFTQKCVRTQHICQSRHRRWVINVEVSTRAESYNDKAVLLRVRSTRHPEGSQRPTGWPAADSPRDVWWTVSRNCTVLFLSCDVKNTKFNQYMPVLLSSLNTLRQRQNGRHFADDTFNRIFVNENARISIKFSLKFVPKGPVNNIPALVQIMAWRRPGDKPLSESMMVSLMTHICVTRPQWVNVSGSRFRKIVMYWMWRDLALWRHGGGAWHNGSILTTSSGIKDIAIVL